MLVAAVVPSTKVAADLFPLPLRVIPRGSKRPAPAPLRYAPPSVWPGLARCKVTIIATQTRRRAMTTNCIKFTSADIETAKGVGSISTLTFDLDITVEPVASTNPMAPTHRVLGRSPRGKLVECGGIWKKQNKETGADYYTLTIRDHGFNANLGKAANQEDLSLQAVIPWGPKDTA